MIKKFKIISGGQTGAARAALDWAMGKEIPHGGWCSKGRLAEDGVIDAKYQLQETPEENSAQRTEWNVRDADGTVIFVLHAPPTGGSAFTQKCCERWKKPFLILQTGTLVNQAKMFRSFLQKYKIETLFIAGSRESKEPGIAAFVKKELDEAFEEEFRG